MDKKYLENIIAKFLNNEASSEEKVFLKEAIQSEENLKLLQSYIQANHFVEKEFASFDSMESLKNFQEKTEKDQILRVDWKRKSLQILKYAAVIAIAVSIGLGLYLKNDTELKSNDEITLEFNDGTKKIIKSGDIRNIRGADGSLLGQQDRGKLIYNENGSQDAVLEYHKLVVPNGKKFDIELSDGSSIYLNSGSTLKYPVQFIKGQSREVFLDGEAYFEVAKNKEDSFIVNTKDLNTEVYGTEFNVSAYESDHRTYVVLVEGSVGVSMSDSHKINAETVVLKPMEKAEWDMENQEVLRKEVALEKYIAWKEGILMFDNERFEVIVKKLERHFDVSITNNYKDLNRNRYTAVFDIESIEDILNTFSDKQPFEFKINDKEIFINPK